MTEGELQEEEKRGDIKINYLFCIICEMMRIRMDGDRHGWGFGLCYIDT